MTLDNGTSGDYEFEIGMKLRSSDNLYSYNYVLTGYIQADNGDINIIIY